jgi:lactoylglutathione lyase
MHTMLNVADMDRALAFYCGLLGMTVQADRSGQQPGRRNLFLGFGPEESTTLIELCSEAGRHSYAKGEAFGHIAIAVDDVRQVCAGLAGAGVEIVREAKAALSGAQIAMVRDPDGYLLELIQPAAPK